jgi:uncharacterized repeat protein (TIGR03806 family)
MRGIWRRFAPAAVFLFAGCGGPAPPVTLHPADAVPDRLSEWQVLRVDGERLLLNDGVIPYDLNTPLFSDYALKLRTLWMPDGQAASYRENRELDFPVGTILTKTFHYRRADRGFDRVDAEATLAEDGSLNLGKHRVVETRLLVRYDDGWKALPYVWNVEQTDAFLEVAGAQFEFAFGDQGFAYVVPDMNQCAGCHAPDHSTKDIRPLGPRAHQLNRSFAYVSGEQNQLDYWARSGRLNGKPASVPRAARWSERRGEPVDDLARAYLDVNCAHCHNPAGPADTSGLNLDLAAEVGRSFGICKPPVAVGRGSGNRPYDIVPGKPDRSILLFRMEHDDPAIMMPELGRAMAHAEGVALISQWIEGLPGDC